MSHKLLLALLCLLMVPTAAAITQDLQHHYTFDAALGADSAGSQDGTITGATSTTGVQGQAAQFDGNDRIDIGNFNLAGNQMTIAAWVKADAWTNTNREGRMLSKATSTSGQDHYWMLGSYARESDTTLRFRLKTGGSTTTLIAPQGAMNTNQWYHAAATYDGSTMRVYMDGTLIGSQSKSGTITSSGADVWIGDNPGGASRGWQGAIDDLRIYDRALSQAEIQTLAGEEVSQPTQEEITLGAFTERSMMNRARGEHANFVYNNQIYVLGGIYNSQDGPSVIERYNPSTDTWQDIGTMPRPRHHITAGASVYESSRGPEVWIAGGKDGNQNTGKRWVDIYEVDTGQWRQGPDLPEVMWGAPAIVVGDNLHVIGGSQSNTNTLTSHYSLDLSNPSATWQTRADLPMARVHTAGVELNGLIYIIGGEIQHAHTGDRADLQVYNPSTNSWSTAASLPQPRSHVEWNTFTYKGKIYSVSGVDSSNNPRAQATIYVYDPETNVWSQLRNLPERLASPGAKIIDDVLYVFGGGVDDWFGGDMRATYSAPVSIQDQPPADNQAPQISISSPNNNQEVSAHSDLTITAQASDDSGITLVEFYAGEDKIGEDSTQPYSTVWSNLPAPSEISGDSIGWSGANTVSGASHVTTTITGDFNGDGIDDVAAFEGGRHSSASKLFAWFEAPSMTKHDINSNFATKPFLGSANAADFDGDGDLDIAFTMDFHSGSANEGWVYWAENPGGSATGNWQIHEVWHFTSGTEHINDMVIDDIDNDGKYDIAIRHLENRRVRLLFQDSLPNQWTLKTIDVKPREGMSIGDLDGDGRKDILLNGFWLAAPNNPRTGTWTEYTIDDDFYTQADTGLNNAAKTDIADFDGDGDLDIGIATAEGQAAKFSLYKNPGNPRTQSWQEIVLEPGISEYHQVEFGDIDKDGDLDVMSGHRFEQGVFVYYQQNDGSFDRYTVTGAEGLYFGKLGDLDGDGDLDIVGPTRYAGQLYFYENQLSGQQASTHVDLTARATDNDGADTLSNPISITITADGATPPTANFALNTDQGTAPLTVSFDGSSSTDDETIVNYQWTFGDGSSASGSSSQHTYQQAGIYTATLTVTDNDELSDTQEQQIYVQQAPPAAPTIQLAGGWNLISHIDSTLSQLQQECQDLQVLYEWNPQNQEYAQTTTPNSGQAMWAYSTRTCTIEIEEIANQPNLQQGWNFIASMTDYSTCNILAGPYIYDNPSNQWIQQEPTQPGTGMLVWAETTC